MKKIYTEVYLHETNGEIVCIGRWEDPEMAHRFMRNYIKQCPDKWANGAWHEYREVTPEE